MSNRFDPWAFLRDVLIRGRYIAQDYDGESYERYSARLDAAARELADRLRPHLAEQHPDDAEPVTEDWLRAAGFHPSAEYRVAVRLDFLCFAPPTSDGRWEPLIKDGARFRRLPACQTRGDVRRLCRALGVELWGPA